MNSNEETSSRFQVMWRKCKCGRALQRSVPPDIAPFLQVVTAIFGYSACSSTLLLANKAALFYFNRPSLVSFVQISFAAFVLFVMKYLIGVEVDDLEWEKIKPYSVYIFAFVSAVYANMRALSVSNVETVIVFRACTPLAITIVDFLFMGRSLPSLRSTLSLCAVSLCAVLYCITDSEFAVKGIEAYYWVSIYFCLIVFEMTYGKRLTSEVKMKSVWVRFTRAICIYSLIYNSVAYTIAISCAT